MVIRQSVKIRKLLNFLAFFVKRELTLLWSKLQRRLDPSLMSLLERCLQLGAIAKTVYHLLSLVRVIQTEVSPTARLSVFIHELC